VENLQIINVFIKHSTVPVSYHKHSSLLASSSDSSCSFNNGLPSLIAILLLFWLDPFLCTGKLGTKLLQGVLGADRDNHPFENILAPLLLGPSYSGMYSVFALALLCKQLLLDLGSCGGIGLFCWGSCWILSRSSFISRVGLVALGGESGEPRLARLLMSEPVMLLVTLYCSSWR
jgi:hypothetical protein